MYEIYKDLWDEVATAGVYASLGDCMKSGCTTSNDLRYPHPVGEHGHLAESRHEAKFTYEKFGCSPVKWFYKQNLLGDRFYYAHCIQLDDEDIRIMSDTKTGVFSCPISNMYLSSGACRIKNSGLKSGYRIKRKRL